MDCNEEHGGERQDDAVEHIEAQQGVGVDLIPSEEQEVNLAADEGNRGGDVGANGDGPVGELIPGEQVAGVAEEQGDEEQDDADDPVELAWSAVGSAIEDFEHVREDEEDHGLCGPAVEVAQEESGGDDKLQVLHVGVGLGHGGVVVEHEQDAGNDEDEKGAQGKGSEVPGGAELQHPGADLGGEEVEEEILLDGERAMQRAVTGAATEDGAIDPVLLNLLHDFFCLSGHSQGLKFLGTAGGGCRWSDRP